MYLKKADKTLADFKKIATWDNHPDILPFITANFAEAPHSEVDPYQLFKHREKRQLYFMMENDRAIGYIDYIINPPHLVVKRQNSAWLSLCIGDPAYWGKGYARQALSDVEQIIWQSGTTRIELGVFAYNKRALRLYQSLGYRHLCELARFTYYQSAWHSDYRLEKHSPHLEDSHE